MRDMRVSFRWGDEVFAPVVDMALVGEVESEFGGVPYLAARFAGVEWTFHECVCLLQILMQAAGRSVDYYILGEALLRGEIADAHGVLLRFLNLVVQGAGA